VESAGDDTNGDKDEEEVDIVAGQSGPEDIGDMLGKRLPLGLIVVAVAAGAQERGRLGGRAIGWRHFVDVAAVLTAGTMELALYVLCQAHTG
jgi:hypothetical protein